jgi:uncharacterized protein GlcG (DUF336 family)
MLLLFPLFLNKPRKPTTMNDIRLEQVEKALGAALQKAKDINVAMNIAVVDAGANIKGFLRMDNAWLGSIDIAIRKAKTARYFDMSSEDLGKMSQPGKPLYGIEVSNEGLIIFGGGIPIKDVDGNVIGAIGVSGGVVDQDIEVAQAGVDALK